jgi:NAD(P)-dependent dehydrogenase (short-subunit alcohol dehydrogenase family)
VIEASKDPKATEAALAASSPLNRIATTEEIATAILYLASDAARFMTGSALQIDGGTTAGHPRRD